MFYNIFPYFTGTVRGERAHFRACRCKINHYRLDRFGPCFPCPVYGICKNEILYFRNGYFVDWDSTNTNISYYLKFMENINTVGNEYDPRYSSMREGLPTANRCLDPKACKTNLSTSCQYSYKGFLCDGCINGYYKTGRFCSLCPNKQELIRNVSITIVVLLLAIGMVATLVVTKSSNDKLSRLLSKTKICLNYYQIFPQIYDALNFISWSKVMVSLIKYLKLLELNPLTIISIQCWFSGFNLYHNYMIFASVNVCLITITVVGIISLNRFHLLGLINHEQIHHFRKTLIAATSILIFFLYPQTSVAVIQILPLS